MVERAFNIGDLMLQHDAKLHMPSFMRRQDDKAKTLNQSEILKTRNIASLRIHAKHAVARMKNFRILSKTINFVFASSVSDLGDGCSFL